MDATQIKLIEDLVKAGEQDDFCKKAFALANLNKTVTELVNLILSSPKSDAPKWLDGEKGMRKGTKAGDAKSINTILREKANYDACNVLLSKYARQALNFRNWATHYEQTDSKKFKTKKVDGVKCLKFKSAKKGGTKSKKDESVLHSDLLKAIQETINEKRGNYTEDSRAILLNVLAKINVKETALPVVPK